MTTDLEFTTTAHREFAVGPLTVTARAWPAALRTFVEARQTESLGDALSGLLEDALDDADGIALTAALRDDEIDQPALASFALSVLDFLTESLEPRGQV